MVTLHGHIGAERGDRGGVTRQSFETGLQDAPIFCSDSGAALMRHPDFHAGKVPQQGSEFCKDPIAGRTQHELLTEEHWRTAVGGVPGGLEHDIFQRAEPELPI